jgi:hypothetical protein
MNNAHSFDARRKTPAEFWYRNFLEVANLVKRRGGGEAENMNTEKNAKRVLRMGHRCSWELCPVAALDAQLADSGTRH